MPDSAEPRRRYRSERRQQQALATRRRILETAARLFVLHGYAGTTIEDVATEARVATPTVYAAFTSKRELLAQTVRFAVRGDEGPQSLLERAGPRAVRDAADQREQLRLFARDITTILERVGPLMDVVGAAALQEPEIAALRKRMQRERLANHRSMIGWLVTRGPLRTGMTVAGAAELSWTLASPEVHRLLRREQQWSKARFARWLAASLTTLLLPD